MFQDANQGGSPPEGPEASLRVSDRERERVVDLLSGHAAEGRLTLEELDARIDGAHAARTRGELAALTADLPADGKGNPGRVDPETTAAGRGARAPLPRLSREVAVYVVVNVALVVVWALSGGGYFWPAWSILGWGLGLVKGGPHARRRAARCAGHREPASNLTRTAG